MDRTDCDCYACQQKRHTETLRLIGLERAIRNNHKKIKTWYCRFCKQEFSNFHKLSIHLREQHAI